MNDQEFREQYKRLTDVHPMFFKASEKMNTIWDYVKNLDQNWFRQQVDRIVGATDPRGERYDLIAAALGERRHQAALRKADEISEAADSWKYVEGKGLGKVLDLYGCSSLLEAVEKSRKGESA